MDTDREALHFYIQQVARDAAREAVDEIREELHTIQPSTELEARVTAIETALRMSAHMALEHLPVPAPGHHLLTDVDPVPYDTLH